MKTFNQWLNEGRTVTNAHYANIYRVECEDGFSVSIQASSGHYCSPRKTLHDVQDYYEFELGYPTEADASLIQYAEDTYHPTDTVYPFVPRHVVERVIESHGGIVGYAS